MTHIDRFNDALENGTITNGDELYDLEKFMKFSVEVDRLKKQLIFQMGLVDSKLKPEEWYVGITGQSEEDRLSGHRSNFPDLDEGTWKEIKADSPRMAIEIESRLKEGRYRTYTTEETKDSDRPGNQALDPDVVYAFVHNFKD
ncbi:MAG: hypothetical protein QNK23_00925 [Crocinitomicaceae bacterium]|nr:hypothetical protein [Crocinitomicaceae bacterium]